MTHRRGTLLAAIVGSGVPTLDGTIVNVAPQAIEHDLGRGPAAQMPSRKRATRLPALTGDQFSSAISS